jgi:hypothetical protein
VVQARRDDTPSETSGHTTMVYSPRQPGAEALRRLGPATQPGPVQLPAPMALAAPTLPGLEGRSPQASRLGAADAPGGSPARTPPGTWDAAPTLPQRAPSLPAPGAAPAAALSGPVTSAPPPVVNLHQLATQVQGALDMEKLIAQVQRQLRRRLAVEQERQGGTRWTT